MTRVRMATMIEDGERTITKNHQMRKKYTVQLGENELVLKVPFFLLRKKIYAFNLFIIHLLALFPLVVFTDCVCFNEGTGFIERRRKCL